MRLLFQLVARVLCVASMCLAGAVAWATLDAHRQLDNATVASAERVTAALESLYWREVLWRSSTNRGRLIPMPEWRTLDTLKLVSPGICVTFNTQASETPPLCGQSEGLGGTPPALFTALYSTVFGAPITVSGRISNRVPEIGTLAVRADESAAMRLAWTRIGDIMAIAALMAAAISIFASLSIVHALAPARSIAAALRQMADGAYHVTLPRFRSMELAMIGRAVTDLGERLRRTSEERMVLTQRLIEIRRDERQSLARELHDEFGQNLTAILAFADTIRATHAETHPETSEDAAVISQAARRVMVSVRGALDRLHNPLADELGLEASLVRLVDGSSPSRAGAPRVRLDLCGDVDSIPPTVAATVYRVAQECLTNALRHGAASEVALRIERQAGAQDALLVSVEDDGTGDAAKIAESPGYGLKGVGERVSAFGGSLSIARVAGKLRVAATIPLAQAA